MPEVNEIDPIYSRYTSKFPGFRSAPASAPSGGGAGTGVADPVTIPGVTLRKRLTPEERDRDADRTGNPTTDRVSRRDAPPGKNPGLESDLNTQSRVDAALEKAGGYALDAGVNVALSGLGLGPVKTAYDLANKAYDHFAGDDDSGSTASTDPVDPVGGTGGSIGGNSGGNREVADRIGHGGNVGGAGSSGGPPGSPGNQGNGPGGSGPGGAVGGERGDGGSSFHEGGYVKGDMDNQPREDVPNVTLQEQEFVVPADMVQAIGPTNLEALRRGLVDPAALGQFIQQQMMQQQPQADPMSFRGVAPQPY